jgi:hypothetical protein
MAVRTLPGAGLTGGWAVGASGWGSPMEANLRAVSAAMQLSVESATSALPGTPSDGSIYIVPSGAEANKVAVRDAGAWVYLTPQIGWVAWVKDTEKFIHYDNASAWVDFPAGGAEALGELTDVDLAITPLAGNILKYNGATWSATADVEPATSAATSYTLGASDAGRIISFSAASAINLTVPTNASVGYRVGTTIHIRQAGDGQITIAGAEGVTLESDETLKTRKKFAVVGLTKIATNTWAVYGSLEAEL